ncbi:oocyte zinc finger protein XlCOF7.1-like [Pseudophryne corroboree]|uniref:oocyte zinc finger protein XlCOF7.1-like n=1 Tax=Pseudophryne corroboree TaxID=495146 RepID=UPI003081A942
MLKRMDKDRRHMTERILSLTLEIIYLLTGEDYTVVKKSRNGVTNIRCPGGGSSTQNPIMEPQPRSLKYERDNDQKILGLTNKIIQLLTGEVPIRCQDVAVYISMEEWDYIEEHKDLYKDVFRKNQHPLRSSAATPPTPKEDKDDTDKCDEERRHLCVIAVSQTASELVHSPAVQCTAHTIKDLAADMPDVCTAQTEGASILIKSEPALCDVGDVIDPVTYSPAQQPHSEYSPAPLGVEPTVHQEKLYSASHICNATEQEGCEYLYITEDGNTHVTSNKLSVVTKCMECGDHFTVESHEARREKTQPYMCQACSTRDSDLVMYRPDDQECQAVTFSGLPKKSNVLHEDYHKSGTQCDGNKHLDGQNISCSGDKPDSYTEWLTNTLSHASHHRTYVEENMLSSWQEVAGFNQQTSVDTSGRGYTEVEPFFSSQSGKYIKAQVMPHQTGHADDRPFNCIECGKCFEQSLSLVDHMRVHAGENPSACPDCGQCFTQRSALSAHRRSHKAEKLFLCFDCGKCFRTKADLVTHQRIHMGEKPFPCPACGEGFTRRANLVRHQRIHTGEKPFSCSYCGRSFTRKLGLVKHQRIHTEANAFPKVHKHRFPQIMGGIQLPATCSPGRFARHPPQFMAAGSRSKVFATP